MTLAVPSGFSQLAVLPGNSSLPAPALPLGAAVALVLAILTAVPNRKLRNKFFGNRSSDN